MMGHARAKSINLLLYEGDLNGVISIEDTSWNSGELYSAPRDSVSELLDIINPPHSRVASPKSACSDPAIRTIVMVTQGVSETVVLEKEQAHNLFMSAENVQGNLLEEYISVSTRPYGWIWCAGNTLRAIDFCSSDGAVLLQVKNKSNTENSSSSNIRQGTTILKWYRLGTRTVRGQKVPIYKWDALNTIINDHRTSFHLPPCNMTEEHYIQFISNLANLNHDLITAE